MKKLMTLTGLCLTTAVLSGAIFPLSPSEGETIARVPDAQKCVMNVPTLEERIKLLQEDRKLDKVLNRDKFWRKACPLVLKLRATAGENGPWKVLIGKKPDLSDARIWYVKTLEPDAETGHEIESGTTQVVVKVEIPMSNLEIGMRYYWKVVCRGRCGWACDPKHGCVERSKVAETSIASFVTEDFAPRWIGIEGRVGNMRDLGGRIGVGGRRLRQGLVFRGEGLNDNSLTGETKGRNRLMVEDVSYLVETLGIRTDLDLRSHAETADMTVSPMGPAVRFVHIPTESYREIFKPKGMKMMARAFRIFCDRANYPVYFHCIAGADRTGALAYMLNGALGVSRHEAETDWESTFYPRIPDEKPDLDFWCRESHFNDGLAKYGDANASWNDRVVLYLKDCGVTDEEIARVREIMLEECEERLSDFRTEENVLHRYAARLPPSVRVGFAETLIGNSAEGFSITSGGSRVIVSGASRRARLFGLGRLLREPGFRGVSSPDMPVRGIYFATHFGNWYDNAGEREMRDYIEDLALWGCNQVRVWFDMHDFRGMDDPDAAPHVARLKMILRVAADCGLETSMLGLANEAFADSPDVLRADWRGGQNGYTRDLAGHYHVELCPSKPGGLEQILAWRAQMLDSFADRPLSQFVIFPYDQGGCTCADCAPWGRNGMMKIVPGFSRLLREKMPGCRVELATWYFDHFGGLGEWQGLFERGGELKRHVDGLLVDKFGPIAHGTPGDLPASAMSEISMRGMLPWGCFGANPQPKRFAAEVTKGRGKLTGFRPYSEGVYEDLNKVLLLQLAWDGKQTAEDVVGAYAAFHFGEVARTAVVKAADLLEDDLGFDVRIVQGAKSYTAYDCAKVDASKPFAFRLSGKRPDPARAEAAERLLSEVDAKLPTDVRTSWRWRILLLRARIDRALARGAEVGDEVVQVACRELCDIYRVCGKTEPFLTPPGPAFDPRSFRAGHL